MILTFIFHYLLWLFHAYWFGYIILDLMHLLLFILATWLLFALAGLPTNNPEFVCSDLAGWTEVDLQLRTRPTSRSRQISRSSIPSFLLARFPLSAREFLSFVPFPVYFCTTWWCNIYVILCQSLWWLSTCTFVLECVTPRISALWSLYCIVLMLSVHTWWYHHPACVLAVASPYPPDRGAT